ncbi:MAG: hypothetical protein M1834_000971 [Cirrosporium novae-zelandiae]|nr:MAG: hypothetical protein M1834_000971 [Cirrosporium novae-zelandiae]
MDLPSTPDTSKSPDTLPSEITRPAKKRRRPALSCVICRDRKVKCDRAIPCARCTKAGYANLCAYSEISSKRAKPSLRPGRPSQDLTTLAGDASFTFPPNLLTETCDNTRTHVYGINPNNPIQKHLPPDISPTELLALNLQYPDLGDSHDREVMAETIFFKGIDSQTRFSGHSCPKNFYSRFEDLRRYIRETKTQNPSMNRLRDDVKGLKARYPIEPRKEVNLDKLSLQQLLPNRAIADELIEIYLDKIELRRRLFHIPTFRREYCKFWEKPQNVAPTFLAQLLLMMSTVLVHREYGLSGIMGKTHLAREVAAKWIQATESWLKIQSLQNPFLQELDMNMIIIHCLLIISREANAIGKCQIWTSTGAVVKFAMSAGYHREPLRNAKISQFRREMRRRIWATIVELDLQASIDRGMPPSIRVGDFDTRPPLNINDDEIDESTGELPIPEPLDNPTDSSYQILLLQSLCLRLRICTLINSINPQVSYENILILDEEIRKALKNIPTWSESNADDLKSRQMFLLKPLLDLTLRQYFLVLHTPFASKEIARFSHSRRVCLETATSMLCQYTSILESGNIICDSLHNDAFRSGVTICRELYLSGDGDYGSSIVVHVIPSLASSLLSLVDKALNFLEKRVYSLGKSFSEYYLLAMVLALVKTKLWPQSKDIARNEAVDLVVKTGYKVYSFRVLALENSQGNNELVQELLGIEPSQCAPVSMKKDVTSEFKDVPQNDFTDTEFPVSDDLSILMEEFNSEIFGSWTEDDTFHF